MRYFYYLTLGVFLCTLTGCPEKGEQPAPKKERVPLDEPIVLTFGSKYEGEMKGFKYPGCGSPTTYQNLNFNLLDNIPGDDVPCGSKILETYLGLNIGTTLSVDVSYYSGISTVYVSATVGCDVGNITVSLYDMDDKLIATDEMHYGKNQVNFSKYGGEISLSELKEIKITKVCEGGPHQIKLYY